MNFHVLYVLELKTSEKNPSVCLSVCLTICLSDYLSVRLYVRTLGRLQNFSGCRITFEGVKAFKKNFVGVFYV